MTTARFRSCAFFVVSFGGVAMAAGQTAEPQPPNETIRRAIERQAAATTKPFDDPGAAAEYFWRKRQGPGPDFDAPAAYRVAQQHMRRMPRYSSRLGAAVTAQPGPSIFGPASVALKRLLGVWEALGPGNIGGRTRALLIHPDQPEIMYAGGVSGGVWKTTDGGQSWIPLADEIANIAVNSMAMRPDDPNTIYIGTGEGYFREEVRGTWLPLRGAGIFQSTNGGLTWERLESTDNEDFYWVNDLIISTKDPDRIYAATRTGVHISSDGGGTWEHSLVATQKGGCLDLAVRDDQANDWLFASCGTLDQATVYRRKIAGGTAWEPVLSEPGMGRTTLAIAPSRQNTIYALSASNVPGPNGVFEQALHAVYRSTSGGAAGSWETRVDNTDPNKLNTLLLTNPVTSSYTDCGWASYDPWVPMGWYCNVIAVDPVDPNVVWAAGVDLFRSDNGGRDWGIASYWWGFQDPSYAHADQHAIVFHPDFDGDNATRMFTAGDGGIYSTDNPYGLLATDTAGICDPRASRVFFRSYNTNMGITQFYHGTPYPGGERYIGGTQDNGTVLGVDALGTDSWSFVLGGDGGYTAVDPTSPNIVYAESQWFGFGKSTDGGRTYDYAANGIDEAGFLFITPFTMDLNESQRLWTGGYRLWRTDNAAALWNPASRTPIGPGQISAIAVAPGNSQRVVAGSSEGDVYRSFSALSTTGSSTWSSSRPRDGFVSSLAFEPGSQHVVYATYAGFGGQHLWRSEDYALTWEPLDGSAGSTALPDIPVHSVVVDPENVKRIYLGTDLGVFTSANRGRTWAIENTGFANVVTEWLAIGDGPDGQPMLFAFTHGRGAWRVDLSPTHDAPRRPSGRVTP